jgi:hypothetical protein
VLYFVKNAHKLPDAARQRAAENLKVACAWYSLDVPEEVEKIAAGLLGGIKAIGGGAVRAAKNVGGAARAAVGGTAGVVKGLGEAAASPFHAAKALTNPIGYAKKNPIGAAMTAMTLPSTIKGVGGQMKQNLAKVRAGEAMHGVQGGLAAMGGGIEHLASANIDELVLRDAFGKHADVTSTVDMPVSVDPKKMSLPASSSIKKTAHMEPIVDVTHLDVPATLREKKAQRYALSDRYPLDSYAQVKQAADFFSSYGRRLSPEDRHEFCSNLVKRASDLSIELPAIVRKYGSEKYASASELEVALDTRRTLLSDNREAMGLLDKIAEAAAVMPPSDFCTLLSQFDQSYDLDHHYDANVMDPYYSTYGFQKTAEDEKAEFSVTIGNLHVHAKDLDGLKGNKKWLTDTFGEDFCEEYCKDPIGIYKSMPVEQKKLIIRMATENSPV